MLKKFDCKRRVTWVQLSWLTSYLWSSYECCFWLLLSLDVCISVLVGLFSYNSIKLHNTRSSHFSIWFQWCCTLILFVPIWSHCRRYCSEIGWIQQPTMWCTVEQCCFHTVVCLKGSSSGRKVALSENEMSITQSFTAYILPLPLFMMDLTYGFTLNIIIQQINH